MKIAALAGNERTDLFSWAMIGMRLVMAGRVTTIVAPREGGWSDAVGIVFRGVRRAEKPSKSSGLIPWVLSQSLISWRRLSGE